MTLRISISPEAEASLRARASAVGLEAGRYAVQLLEQALMGDGAGTNRPRMDRTFKPPDITAEELSALLGEDSSLPDLRPRRSSRRPAKRCKPR